MSSEIRSVGRRLRAAITGSLLALAAGLVLAPPPLQAQPVAPRDAKCPACAEAAYAVGRAARVVSESKTELDRGGRDLAKAEASRQEADEDLKRVQQAVDDAPEGFPVNLNQLDDAKGLSGYLQIEYARALSEYGRLSQAYARALVDLGEAMSRLQICEEQNCRPAGPGVPLAMTIVPTPVPAPPGLLMGQRSAACPQCAESAAARNAIADRMDRHEAEMQRVRDLLANNARATQALAARETTLNLIRAKIREREAAGKPVTDAQRSAVKERETKLFNDRFKLGTQREDLEQILEQHGRIRARFHAQFLEADKALTVCERLLCGRVQADAAPVTSPGVPVQTATPPGQAAPPAGTTTGPQSPSEYKTRRRVEVLKDEPYTPPQPTPRRVEILKRNKAKAQGEVIFFGGASADVSRLKLTGVDNFFGPGAELIDQRSSSTPRPVAPALGFFARYYFDSPGFDSAPEPRFFFTVGAIITPFRGDRGFETTGVNTVPAGDVRTETWRAFVAPIMVGYQMPVMAGTTPLSLDFMAGIAVGHETTRVTLLREGGAPGGPGAIAESSGFFVDPIIGLAVSAPLGDIEGLGPVRLGVMGLAMIGTGGRSARVQSPNYASQSYTGEHRRQIEFFFGATLTFGLF